MTPLGWVVTIATGIVGYLLGGILWAALALLVLFGCVAIGAWADRS